LKNYKLPEYVDRKDSLVAFIDILGFDEKVRNIKSEDDFQEVATLLFSIKEVEKKYGNEKKLRPNLNITAISDSVILSIPISDSTSVVSLFSLLHRFQYELLIKFKTLIRGYITRGFVYQKDNIVFGKGYSEAYKKENQIGHAPRIVLDHVLVEDAKRVVSKNKNRENDFSVFDFLIEDHCDGSHFLDYLKPVGELVGISKQQYLDERAAIKSFINVNLTNHRDDQKVIRVYKWLNNYYLSTDRYFT